MLGILFFFLFWVLSFFWFDKIDLYAFSHSTRQSLHKCISEHKIHPMVLPQSGPPALCTPVMTTRWFNHSQRYPVPYPTPTFWLIMDCSNCSTSCQIYSIFSVVMSDIYEGSEREEAHDCKCSAGQNNSSSATSVTATSRNSSLCEEYRLLMPDFPCLDHLFTGLADFSSWLGTGAEYFYAICTIPKHSWPLKSGCSLPCSKMVWVLLSGMFEELCCAWPLCCCTCMWSAWTQCTHDDMRFLFQ